MQTVTLVSAFLLAALVFLAAPRDANAACCWPKRSTCQDGKHAYPFCGNGRCNIFGCNCEGGCREAGGRKGPRMSELEGAEQLVKEGDSNGDGLLSAKELEAVLQRERD